MHRWRRMIVVLFALQLPSIAQTSHWTNVTATAGTPPVEGVTMAFDEAHGETVLWGSIQSQTQFLQQTWLWDGTKWSLKNPSTVPTEYYASMVYDEARAQIVLVGTNTWVWDGENWSAKGSAPPGLGTPNSNPIRSLVVYDSVHLEVVAFVGANVWIWNGTTWTQQAAAAAPLGGYATIAFDRLRGQVVLSSGTSTYTWSGTAWLQAHPAHGPIASYGGLSMAFDDDLGGILLYSLNPYGGGYGSVETWLWDGIDWTLQNPATAPPPRYFPNIVYDSVRRQIVLFGGFVGQNRLSGQFSDTWTFGTTTAQTGTIHVSTNLSSATFTISGPATYTGSGSSFTQPNALPGTYTVTYGNTICFGVPVSQTKTLTPGGSIAFDPGLYQGQLSISIGLTPSAATSGTFSINPPVAGMRLTGPYPVLQTNVWPEQYTVTYNLIPGFTTPPQQTLSHSGNCALQFTGNYTPIQPSSTAMLSITTTIPAGYVIYHDGKFVSSGYSTSQQSLPAPGTYTIKYDPIILGGPIGYFTPPQQTITLNPGDSVQLSGVYRRLIMVAFTGWNDAPTPSNCIAINPTIGAGIQYPEIDWNDVAGRGMTVLLYKIKQTPALSQGAHLAGFTFYSTDGQGNPLGDACTPGFDYPHAEAMSWVASQNVTSNDIVVVLGHSYGGNRARRFVNDLKQAGQAVHLLATVDPIDWDFCNVQGVFTNSPTGACDQSAWLYSHNAKAAMSFHQILGQQFCAPLSPVVCFIFPVKGYELANATVTVRPDYHMDIDDDTTMLTTVTNSILNLIRGPQVTSSIGTATRLGSTITIPVRMLVSGSGIATGITITAASINGVPCTNIANLPTLGDVPAGASSISVGLTFPAAAASANSSALLTVTGTYSYGQTFSNTIGRIIIP